MFIIRYDSTSTVYTVHHYSVSLQRIITTHRYSTWIVSGRNAHLFSKGILVMLIYLVRHGETEWNKAHRLQGRSDIKLNEKGRELALITGKAFEDRSLDVIFSSPLIRAYETASLIRGHRDTSIVCDDRIKEICFGDYEGKETEELMKDGSGRLQAFFGETEKYDPPDGGESIDELRARTQSFLDDKILACENIYDNVMIVAHGACNCSIRLNMLKLPNDQFWKGAYQHNCCVSTIELKNGKYTMQDECRTYYDVCDS